VTRVEARRRQRGVAAITAILIVAIATIVAVNMLWRTRLDQRRTEAMLVADQGWLFLRGAEDWAADILRIDRQETGPDSDHLGELWANELEPLPIDGGFIAGRIEDLHGRFNVNNLITAAGEADPLAIEQFARLLASIELDPDLATVVADWIDADTQPGFPRGAEDGAYTGLEVPYRPPNLPITSTSELMAIEGFDAESYRRLAPFIAALPPGTRLNVNTASAEVLASLSEELTVEEALMLIEDRGEADFPDYELTFSERLTPEMMGRIDETSRFFRLTGIVSIGATEITMYSLLDRDNQGFARPVFRSLGTD
jgi:general secretion pathway protein K